MQARDATNDPVVFVRSFRFACACAVEAKKRHYDYIGIEFYGECWAGKNKDFKHGPSENCVRVKKDECAFEACNQKLYGLRKCVGGELALFVYKVYKIRKRI